MPRKSLGQHLMQNPMICSWLWPPSAPLQTFHNCCAVYRFRSPMISKKVPETLLPKTLPNLCQVSRWLFMKCCAEMIPQQARKTTEEWPSAKNMPTWCKQSTTHSQQKNPDLQTEWVTYCTPWINKMNIRAPPKTVILYIYMQLESLRSQPEWCMYCMKTFQNSRQSAIFKSWNRGDV